MRPCSFAKSTKFTLFIVIVSLSFACTNTQVIQLNPWIRVESADQTTIIPHLWYMGNSWGEIQINSGEKWTNVPRSGKSLFRLYSYKSTNYALAVENEWGGPPAHVTIYKADGQSFKIGTGIKFDSAFPLLEEKVIFINFKKRTGLKNIATVFDGRGKLVSKYKFEFPDEVASPHLIGECLGLPVFVDSSRRFWEVSPKKVKRLEQDRHSCISEPKCIAYASQCEL